MRCCVSNIAILAMVFLAIGVVMPSGARGDHMPAPDLCHAETWQSITPDDITRGLSFLDDINQPVCDFGETVLFMAARFGNEDAINTIINAGADPNILAFDGCSAICRAVMWENVDGVDVIYKAGADISLGLDWTGSVIERMVLFAPYESLTVLLKNHYDQTDHISQRIWEIAIHRPSDIAVKALFEIKVAIPKSIQVNEIYFAEHNFPDDIRNYDDALNALNKAYLDKLGRVSSTPTKHSLLEYALLNSPDIGSIDFLVQTLQGKPPGNLSNFKYKYKSLTLIKINRLYRNYQIHEKIDQLLKNKPDELERVFSITLDRKRIVIPVNASFPFVMNGRTYAKLINFFLYDDLTKNKELNDQLSLLLTNNKEALQ